MSQQPSYRPPPFPFKANQDGDDDGPRGNGCLIAGLFLYAGINFIAVLLAQRGIFGIHSLDVLWLFVFVAPLGSLASLVIAQMVAPPERPFSWGVFSLVIISLIAGGFLNLHLIASAVANI